MALNDKQKTKVLVVGFAGILGLAGILYYGLVFGRGQVNDLKRRGETLAKEIEAEKDKLAQIEEIRSNKAKMEEMRTKIQQVKNRLPSSPDAPGFLQAMVAVLRTTGIIQESVRPKGPQNRSQYTEIPYTISSFGRFHEVGQFLTLIEQNPDRFMRVKSFKMTNNLQRPSVHPIDMQIATFMFNPPPAAPTKPLFEAKPSKPAAKKK